MKYVIWAIWAAVALLAVFLWSQPGLVSQMLMLVKVR